jgi:peptidoglycan hydrolase-like protein with peptidoglycan-binding domain
MTIPASEFTCGKTCVAKTSAAKAAFVNLQKQLNRHKAGLVEDGVLGSNTLSAAKRILNNAGLTLSGLATMADSLASSLSTGSSGTKLAVAFAERSRGSLASKLTLPSLFGSLKNRVELPGAVMAQVIGSLDQAKAARGLASTAAVLAVVEIDSSFASKMGEYRVWYDGRGKLKVYDTSSGKLLLNVAETVSVSGVGDDAADVAARIEVGKKLVAQIAKLQSGLTSKSVVGEVAVTIPSTGQPAVVAVEEHGIGGWGLFAGIGVGLGLVGLLVSVVRRHRI